MKVVKLETFLTNAGLRNYLFVRLTTDTGLTGVGEASLEWQEKTVETLIHEWVEDRILASDPRDVERIVGELIRDQYQGGSTVLTAISGVEIALWDLVGKSCGQPVYELLGGKVRERLPAYANGWYGNARTPAEYADRARQVVARGYRALKFDPFGVAWQQLSADETEMAEAKVAAVRAVVGADVDVFIEVHGRLSGEAAIAMGRRLEKYRPGFYEEPVSPYDLDLLKEVKAALPFPIAAGERLYMLEEFARLTSLRAADVAQPDLCHCGGLSMGEKIAALAQTAGILLAPHVSIGPVALCRGAFRLVHCERVHARELFGVRRSLAKRPGARLGFDLPRRVSLAQRPRFGDRTQRGRLCRTSLPQEQLPIVVGQTVARAIHPEYERFMTEQTAPICSDSDELREAIIRACLFMRDRLGYFVGTWGNISVRVQDGLLLTPSRMSYDAIAAEDLVVVGWEGGVVRRPSRAHFRNGIAPPDTAATSGPGRARSQPFSLGVGLRLRRSLDSGAHRQHGQGDRRGDSLCPARSGRASSRTGSSRRGEHRSRYMRRAAWQSRRSGRRTRPGGGGGGQPVCRKSRDDPYPSGSNRRRTADRGEGVARGAAPIPLQIRTAGGLGRHHLGRFTQCTPHAPREERVCSDEVSCMYDVVTVGEGMLRLSPPRYERIRRGARSTCRCAGRRATWPAISLDLD